MNVSEQNQYRTILQGMLQDLQAQDSLAQDSQRTVVLDQQSVGRLSRMDAMQQQAMAIATQHRRDLQKTRIIAALERIETDEFGYCATCGEAIAAKRLELDPAIPTCVSCASSNSRGSST